MNPKKKRRLGTPHYLAVLLLTLPGVCLGETQPTGEEFFQGEVMGQLAQNGCFMCHSPAPGYVKPAMEYRDLLSFLAMGQAANNNVLISKLANLRNPGPGRPAHIGGQRCTSIEAEPCKTLMRWWEIEFGARELGR